MQSKLGYKLVSKDMLTAVMGKDAPALLQKTYDQLDDFDLMLLKQELIAQGVPEPGPAGYLAGSELEAELAVPALLGDNIAQHFEAMANEYLEPMMPLLDELLNAQEPVLPTPEAMIEALAEHGGDVWLSFGLLGELESVDYTLPAKAFVEDCETAVKAAPFSMPILATAISNGKSHLWVSSFLLEGAEMVPLDIGNMPSLGTGKLIAAHNGAYDWARYQERYSMAQQNYGICTMAMQQTACGLDADQRWAARSKADFKPAWAKHGALKSLVATYNHNVAPLGYEPLTEADKETRNIFVTDTMPEILAQLPEALKYAMGDPLYTLRCLKALWPKYKAIVPSNVPLAAHSLLSHSLLQVDAEWHDWLERCDSLVKAELSKMSSLFGATADKYVQQWREGLIELAE